MATVVGEQQAVLQKNSANNSANNSDRTRRYSFGSCSRKDARLFGASAPNLTVANEDKCWSDHETQSTEWSRKSEDVRSAKGLPPAGPSPAEVAAERGAISEDENQKYGANRGRSGARGAAAARKRQAAAYRHSRCRSLSYTETRFLRTSTSILLDISGSSSSSSSSSSSDEVVDNDASSTATKKKKRKRKSTGGGSTTKKSKGTGFLNYPRKKKFTVICLALINFGAYLSMSIIAPFFPMEAEQKGMSLSVTGYVFSTYALVMFAVSPILGKIITIIGVKFTFVSGVFLAAGCNILFGALNFIDDPMTFTVFCFLLRSFEAIGAASFFTASCTMVAELFPDDIGAIFGLMETFVGIGMTAGPAVGGALYALGGYEVPFYTLGSALMLTVPICYFILPDPKVTNTPKQLNGKNSMFQLLRIPSVVIINLVALVLCGIWGFLDPTLEPHLRKFGVSPSTTGLLFLLMAGTYSITCPIAGRISDKYGYQGTLMVAGLVGTACSLILMGPTTLVPFIPSALWLNIVALVLLGVTVGFGLIPTFQVMLDGAIKGGFEDNTVTYGFVSSMFSTSSALGEFLGPAIGGVLFEYNSFDFASTCVAAVTMGTAIILLLYIVCNTSVLRMSSNKGHTSKRASLGSSSSLVSDSSSCGNNNHLSDSGIEVRIQDNSSDDATITPTFSKIPDEKTPLLGNK